jgi:hypothetical protein
VGPHSDTEFKRKKIFFLRSIEAMLNGIHFPVFLFLVNIRATGKKTKVSAAA